MADTRFSFASVILSYFLVGGGLCAGTLLGGGLAAGDQRVLYAVIAAGAFLGGFFASRASRGRTILEPALGALAVIATVVALASTTLIGRLIWTAAQDTTLKYVGLAGAGSAVAAMLGAWISEHLLGDATRSSLPWLLYTALATFGASLLATVLASVAMFSDRNFGSEDLGALTLYGIGAGCLLAGLAVGALARTRPLIASLLGGGLGVTGFFFLVARSSTAADATREYEGLIVLAVGGAVVTAIGTAIGWAAIGRRSADS